ncbi:DinB family protein [Paenibacillus macerans]|nr:DinB family protein [Paenibacillus macerans]
MMLTKPQAGEYAEHFTVYIDKVPEGDLLELLQTQPAFAKEEWGSLTEEQGNYRYAEGKWSLKEVLGHISDTERVMSYRLLRISRGDTTPLPGFDEELFVRHSTFARQPVCALLHDFSVVRESTLSLIRQLDDEAWLRQGNASGVTISARALAYVIAGHAQHHLSMIRERYLQK